MGTVLSSTQERAFSLSQEASQVVSLLARGGELLGRRACGGAGGGAVPESEESGFHVLLHVLSCESMK